MKLFITLVILGFGAGCMGTLMDYGGDCDATDTCKDTKNLDCVAAICTCKVDSANKGKYIAKIATAGTDGCAAACDTTDYKCGDNAECDGSYCKCTTGYIYETAGISGVTIRNFRCKSPATNADCGTTAADFKVESSKCACTAAGKVPKYKIDTGKYACEDASSGCLLTPMVACLVASLALAKFL